jgi:UDPglucose 6-dehydrogenase
MNIGFIGLGKLGLSCAVAIALKGHRVIGYDIDPTLLSKAPRSYPEAGPDGQEPFEPYLKATKLEFGSLSEVVAQSDIIFVAVQTPHQPEYEGITRIPEDPADFSYTYLVSAITELTDLVNHRLVVSIISTVLPGTLRRLIYPIVGTKVHICYNPLFIAMGTTMYDFLHPEFVLLGANDHESADLLESFYRSITHAPICRMSIESAELCKVAYNTYIGQKIVYANTLMEICHKIPGANVTEVCSALKLANSRLLGPRYMDGGMGDGGGCHPRDNIAMSYLARQLGITHDWFRSIMAARERQTEWLADLMCAYSLPKAIIGYSFKAESNLISGSPALLLNNILGERGINVFLYDPHVEQRHQDLSTMSPHVFLIGTNHLTFRNQRFPVGSVVIDPWRYMPAQPDSIKLIQVGIGLEHHD